ncbi:MAG TPA: FAD-dependent oxidoreductase, partial [Rubrobacteraceae bacterium]|nr:FAD-dependent oxidoreductase [Rubrobacteraceae bacterium]
SREELHPLLVTSRSPNAKRVVVVGGGIGGLAAAALLARAGHAVTLLEANAWLGGKSRRIELDGQRMDTGPAIVTFPGVWKELLRRWDALGGDEPAEEIAGLSLRRLPEVGRYYFRGEEVPLPVPEGHRWRGAWERFVGMHGGLGPDITRLLTTDWYEPSIRPALLRLLRLYGARPTTRSYLDRLGWLPEGLREVIAIHTLNAGVGPARTPALYASMPAVMTVDGVWVPEGGVYEIVRSLEKLARAAGAELRTGEPIHSIERGKVTTAQGEYKADAVVSGLDASVLEDILKSGKDRASKGSPLPTPYSLLPKRFSCSGVAIYTALRKELPERTPTHGVVLPSDPEALYATLEANMEPEEAMAFVDYYRPGEPYPNGKGVLALGLTAPPNGGQYGIGDAFVARELKRVGRALRLPRPVEEYFGEHEVLHPGYFAERGSPGGALYGAVRPFWMSGPLHRPRYSDRKRPWLWRVGASVHPGGGIPAVLGGAMISTSRLLRSLRR